LSSPAFVLPREYFSTHPYPEVIPADIDGKFLVAINKDCVPDPSFIKYLTVHEHWGIFIDHKKGFNLGKRSRADFQLPILEQTRPGHRYAIYKELQAAEADGKLENYMEWWRNIMRQI